MTASADHPREQLAEALRPLRRFQRATVEHAFTRLWTAPDTTHRFLVADEVGLGKTMVARGVIAKTIDHLWEREHVGRIDIVYVCSNAAIASQNLDKLRVLHGDSIHVARAGRLTLLAREMGEQPEKSRAGKVQTSFLNARVTLVSLTPGTSFAVGNQAGQSAERVLMLKLLLGMPALRDRPAWRTALVELLRVGVGTARWARETSDQKLRELPLSASIEHRLHELLDGPESKLRDALVALLEQYDAWRASLPEGGDVSEALARDEQRALRSERNRCLGRLRHLLAATSLEQLEPDLVILDEFQRFKELLEPPSKDEDGVEDPDSAQALAQALFNHQTRAGHAVPVLLLSATPYKWYTRHVEDEDDHHKEFIATTKFLMATEEDSVKLVGLRQALRAYRETLIAAAKGNIVDLPSARAAVEGPLRLIMARTERVDATALRDGMLASLEDQADIAPGDVRQYFAADRIFRAVGEQDPMGLWKDAPYLLHFLRGYRFNRDLDAACERRSEALQIALRDTTRDQLKLDALRAYKPIDPANGKLRAMQRQLLEDGQWKLLWVPPSFPYWPLQGPYAGQERFTKRLVFSAWNVVPDVLSALLSYAAEARMHGGGGEYDTETPKAKTPAHSTRLRLQRTSEGLEGLRNLLLVYPCVWLADQVDPREALREGVTDVRAWARDRIAARLKDFEGSTLAEGPAVPLTRNSWIWAASAALDGAEAVPLLKDWLAEDAPEERDDDDASTAAAEKHQHLQAVLEEYRQRMVDVAEGRVSLGPVPEAELLDVLVDVALGSPAVLALRMLRTVHDGALTHARRFALAASVATGFWSLFNRADAVAMLDATYPSLDGYWRRVLRYACDGNLQAVLDEYFHQLRDENRWKPEATTASIAESTSAEIRAVVKPIKSNVKARFLNSGLEESNLQIRTRFALRFGHARDTDDEKAASRDAVRKAFNSPFRPFVLASTSVGQEGLDFHPWCHAVTHWSLPGNPVDLEQREGRVHRFKGHAVRRNVARDFGHEAARNWQPGQDLWDGMFDLAVRARAPGGSDLIPFWIYEGRGEDPFRVLRDVPLLPLSRERQAFVDLMYQLARYRVVFGQPRQQEMVAMLARAGVDGSSLAEWAIRLEPPPWSEGGA